MMLCPLCEMRPLKEPPERNPLSRVDNETYICEVCGIHEAYIDADIDVPEHIVKRHEQFKASLIS